MLHVGCLFTAMVLGGGLALLGWSGLKGGEVFLKIGERQLGRTARLRAGSQT